MKLSRVAAFYLQASIIVSFLAGSAASTPLYAVYQAAWHFSPITVTAIFGIYAIVVLGALLVVGGLSDFIGRRPVLLVATILQTIAMTIFVRATGVGDLVAARVVQGLATGAAAGAVGAGMLDLDRAKGTIANAVGPMLGTGLGVILSGVLVTYLPLPTKLVYLVLAVAYVVQFFGVLAMPETVTKQPGALASLRPKLALPARLRPQVLIATPALIGAWALVGFYASLGATLVRRLAGSSSAVVGGLALFVMAAAGAATVFLTRTRTPRFVLLLGTASLAGGVGVMLLAIANASLVVLAFGTVVAGAGFGAAFQGAIRTVLPLAHAHERAGVLSLLYVIAYLSMGVPAIVGGVRVVYGHGLIQTAEEYGLTVMAFALFAFVGTLVLDRAPRPRFQGEQAGRASGG